MTWLPTDTLKDLKRWKEKWTLTSWNIIHIRFMLTRLVLCRYFQYKQLWEMFKLPGEKDRRTLRLEIKVWRRKCVNIYSQVSPTVLGAVLLSNSCTHCSCMLAVCVTCDTSLNLQHVRNKHACIQFNVFLLLFSRNDLHTSLHQ